MGLPFELTVYPDYLHITHPPRMIIDADSAQEIWGQIGQLCREHGKSKAVLETRGPELRLDTMAAFDSGRILAENTSGLTIALCFYDYEFSDLTTFLKTVAQNRGVRLEFFSEMGAALKWLGVTTGELLNGQP